MKRRAILRSLPAAVAVPALASADRSLAGGAPPSPPVAAKPVRMVRRVPARADRRQDAGVLQAPWRRPHQRRARRGRGRRRPVAARCAAAPQGALRQGRHRARHDPVPVHVVLARRSREASRHHARPGARAREGARGGGDDHPPVRRHRHSGHQVQPLGARRAADAGRDRPRRDEAEHVAPRRGQGSAGADPRRHDAGGGRLGAHHALPHAHRADRHRAQDSARLPSARSRRPRGGAPWRRPRPRHRRGPEAVRRHRAEPVSRPQPVPRHGRRDAAGSAARDPRRDPLVRDAREDLQHPFPQHPRPPRSFEEVFPDEGDMDMAAVLRTLHAVDYPYMVMPDHMPTHADDPAATRRSPTDTATSRR